MLLRKYCKKLFLMVLTFATLFSSNILNVNSLYAINDEESTIVKNDNVDTFEAGATLNDDHVVTTMDENGNIIPLDEVETKMPSESEDSDAKELNLANSRISNSSVAVVNFRTLDIQMDIMQLTELFWVMIMNQIQQK